MARRLTAKIGEYEKDGQTKGKYVDIGVILSNDNGEYALLDPTINLSGVLQKQNMLAHKKLKAGGKARIGESVICSIFSDEAQQQSQPQGGQQSPPADFMDDPPF